MDQELVGATEIPFKAIQTGKLRRYFAWENFVDPFRLVAGFFQSLYHVGRFKPDAVFVKGGFVSVPVALAAYALRKPIVLHESDSVMGLSNRLISRMARSVCVGFPLDPSADEKLVFTGNPVRRSILAGDPEKGYKLTGFKPDKPVLLVWGGSQGAKQINLMLSRSFNQLKGFQIIHVTGKGKQTKLSGSNYKQFEYLGEELKDIYAITNLVVSRSGANSLYELALMQKPSVLVPLKSAAHNHQQINAEYFEEKEAAVILRKPSQLVGVLRLMATDPELYVSMQKNLKKLSKPNAAKKIAELLMEV